jgi:GAF domain-containing protein
VTGETDELQRLRAREAILDYLSGWSSRLHFATERKELAQLTREAVLETTPYRHCWIYVMPHDATSTEMELVMVQGDKAELVVHSMSMLPTEGDAYLQEVLTSPSPAICIDAQTDPRVNREIVTFLGNRTIVNLPLRLLDRRVGAPGGGDLRRRGGWCRPPR